MAYNKTPVKKNTPKTKLKERNNQQKPRPNRQGKIQPQLLSSLAGQHLFLTV
jgi:hypothetical protein